MSRQAEEGAGVMQRIHTGSRSDTAFFEVSSEGGAIEVYPCRCGEIHRLAFAPAKAYQHDCFHDSLLWCLACEDAPNEGEHDPHCLIVMCPDCAKCWHVES